MGVVKFIRTKTKTETKTERETKMGYASAQDMAAHTDIERAVEWHLSCNIYPPVPQYMAPVAIAAIEAVNDDDAEAEIALPEGVHSQTHGKFVPAHAVIEELRLSAFVN